MGNAITDHNHPEDFLISQWQSTDKSVHYVIYRWFIAAFFAFSVFSSILDDVSRGQFLVHFIYFSNIGLIVAMIATLMSAIISTQYKNGKFKQKGKMTARLKIFWFLSTIGVSASCISTLVYWTVIYKPGGKIINLSNMLVHGLNTIFLLIDLFISKQPAKFAMGIYPSISAVIYISFTWVYTLLGGKNKNNENFIYEFFNWNDDIKRSMITGVAIVAITFILHAITTLIQMLRIFICKKINENGKRAKIVEQKLMDPAIIMHGIVED